MRASNPLEYSSELKTKVLNAPMYQEFCDILYDAFVQSRESAEDPKELLSIQAGLAQIIAELQKRKTGFGRESFELGYVTARRLIVLLKQIADSIVWRAFGFDRVEIQLLAEHPKTGHLDDTTSRDFSIAFDIVAQEEAIVLVNDLTTSLRHGDLTVIDRDGGVSFVETKYGKASKHNRRAKRQRRRLNELARFLNTGVRVVNDRRDFIFKADIPIKTYHPVVAEAITRARTHGYHQETIDDWLAIEAFWTKHPNFKRTEPRPFQGEEHVMQFNNLLAFDRPTPRIVPYGVFPLDHKSCYDLMTGEIFLSTSLNFDRLQARYRRYGLPLQIPQPSDREIREYISAPIAERKKIVDKLRFIIGDGNPRLSQTAELFTRIGVEFMHLDTMLEANRQLMNVIENLDLQDDKTTRIYQGFKDERTIWV